MVLSLLLLFSCNITKKVPQDAYLLRDHDFKIVHERGEIITPIDKSELEQVARIRPNRMWLYTRIPIRLHNLIDQERLERDVIRLNTAKHKKNQVKLAKQKRINDSRIQRAREKGDSVYKPYRVKLLDTIKPKPSIRYPGFSVRYVLKSFSQEPVLLNANLVHRSTDQIRLYLEKKGYYHSTVTDTILINPKIGLRKRKNQATVVYTINLGKPHTIDSLYFEGGTRRIHLIITKYLKSKAVLQKGDVFDRELLESLRGDLARQLRNETYYEFSPNHILFKADTTARPSGVRIGISIRPRTIRSKENRDSVVVIPQKEYKVGRVYFHISDTVNYRGNFSEAIKKQGIKYNSSQFLPTLDTFLYQPTGIIHAETRKATFLYNGKLTVNPAVIEMRNYLEDGHWYRAYYQDRSYNQLLELDVFQTIQPVLIDRPDSGLVDVHYYLVPSKVQGYTVEPRATNSNGFLGVAASVSYRHKNVFKKAGKFTASMSAGWETQPAVIDAQGSNTKERTFELGPTAKLVLPGLNPISYLRFSKRQTTSTEFSSGVNFQRRREFERQLFQFNYLWRWRSDKMHTFQMGLPLVSGIKLVRINITDSTFRNRIEDLNDLFLKNAYSNQLIFNDFKFVYNYSNEQVLDNSQVSKRLQINYDMNFDLVGNSIALFKRNDTQTPLGQQQVFGINYSQFMRVDNDLKLFHKFSKGKVLAMRLQAGLGYAYGNSSTAMPFDYAFFAGGSNDNRGWRARELSPGAYQYHLDSTRTITQIGDMRLGASVEYRFKIPYTKRFYAAVFSDAGNIWTLRNDPKREGSQFTKDFYKQLAISGGFGLRLDLSFLIVRFDVGVPIHNPAMSPGAQWIWNSRQLFLDELDLVYGNSPARDNVLRPFVPKFHLAIGFPF
jgi:hypothetical protein